MVACLTVYIHLASGLARSSTIPRPTQPQYREPRRSQANPLPTSAFPHRNRQQDSCSDCRPAIILAHADVVVARVRARHLRFVLLAVKPTLSSRLQALPYRVVPVVRPAVAGPEYLPQPEIRPPLFVPPALLTSAYGRGFSNPSYAVRRRIVTPAVPTALSTWCHPSVHPYQKRCRHTTLTTCPACFTHFYKRAQAFSVNKPE